ncbi:EscU/YscU/HrcU family type III secretion system export apparatus switch protein [Caballeronia sp. EK]|uniref:EscU/YscU/HrcU family type III secretion system export apparatus switch protein n=1 Tax=Caballeronia sp. EK TaxID=2767469 RepID=UPI001654CD17|nr:EscU/YscU/HrcU family type III secretion system export apparatus switch protein [Caballeronia sp. EK]MBC8642781.1 EscU/YscU/HrcU family type III secretion system export apparatus switch protein [Caballeronia sp. EK]
MSQKTEKPTRKRVSDARQEGQIAKSQEVNAAVLLAVTLLWMIAEGASLQTAMAGTITTTISVINLPIRSALSQLSGQFSLLMVRFVFGLAGALSIALVLTGLVQSQFLFAPKALMPSAQRISPLSNVKQIISIRNLFEFAKMVFKVLVLSCIFFYFIKRYSSSFAHLPLAAPESGLAVCVEMAQWMWSILLGLTAVFAIADYTMQHRELIKQLMMSHDDIKQEFKNSEGNPEVKHRRRELHQQVQSGSLAKRVAKSSIVVRNPTHLAVCLRYEAGETPLPQVLEIGRGAFALRIVSEAETQRIPVVESVALARALAASTSPGDYIPEPLFHAVAQVLREVQDRWRDEGGDDVTV